MALKDLVVFLDPSAQSAARLELAASIASHHGARLTGNCLFDLLLPAEAELALSGYAQGVMVDNLRGRFRDTAIEQSARIEAGLAEVGRRNSLASAYRLLDGPALEVAIPPSRLADLVVVGQVDPDNPPPGAGGSLVEELLFSAGRPLLIVPYAGKFESAGERVLIGWNGSREATRAIHDALPLISAAQEVTVLVVNPKAGATSGGEVPGAEIAAHLARHDIKASAAQTVTDNISEADALLDYASDISADLLVVGGYGHSRLREYMLGGVTRSLLNHMTIPVLMSR
jgi:nucleotide-binding universal stress UspA family protein